MPGGASGGVWLHTTDPGLAPALHVLAEQLDDQPEGPRVFVSGDALNPGPGDDPRSIDAQLDHFPTRLIVLAGTTLPVPLIERARSRGVSLMLVDAQSTVTSGRWRILPGHLRSVLAQFCQIHARDAQSAAAIARIVRGAVPVLETGRLARHAAVPGCNVLELDALRDEVSTRPVWLAHDLPLAELDTALLAHSHALRRAHRLLMILQPRDVVQGAHMAHRANEVGFAQALRSNEDQIDETTQVYVADAGDDPGLFLRLAPVAYLGGSLTKGAGTPSPVTAAALGSALVFGPHAAASTRAFLDPLRQQGGGRQIETASDLGPAVSAFLSPEAGADAALRAWTLATEGSDATWTATRAICDWLTLNRGGV